MPKDPTPKPGKDDPQSPSLEERVALLEAQIDRWRKRLGDGDVESRREQRRRHTEEHVVVDSSPPPDPVDLVTVGPVAQLRKHHPRGDS